jgi:hypothetical protein
MGFLTPEFKEDCCVLFSKNSKNSNLDIKLKNTVHGIK